ncbi:berberine bridge enzyme-like Cyn d 4 [Lolium perenne]|uniref:berberine bridge enzyme-like Cyn d 4 n=1 Tax=Lolium perenne TaxID=4522 RepID=UPI0021F64127|nr:berberine bridge enzyme-like Cyn d 4 [Lolium perenne]
MAMRKGFALAFLVSFLSCHLISVPSQASSDGFLQCLRENLPSELVFEQGSSSFTTVLVSSIRNPKFFTNTTVRPLCIVTPTVASHVQAAVRCGRWHGVRLRVRSGGHDYEGLSYRSARSEVFGVVDLAKLRTVSVDRFESTAWVDSGATVGELYYTIAKNNPRLGFPSGVCSTIGVGGHFSGGAIGMMMRKHGLSIDKVIDAKLVNANGDLLDRAGMGEDLFWAIRGGGGESFGIVLSWKVQLVQVPSIVTVFNIGKALDQGTVEILTKWQEVGPSLPDDLTIRVILQRDQALFQALYLGTCRLLAVTMRSKFPELNMTTADCHSMTWLQSAAFINSGNTDVEALLSRNTSLSTFTKNKSDYVRTAISKLDWSNIISWFEMNAAGMIILEPHGGFMGTVPAAATPYPHRNGVLFNIQYIVFWQGDGTATTTWLANFYELMGKHVSNNTREAYVNYRDLDIGQNVVVGDVSTFDGGKVWGEQYFMSNFERLASVKAAVDPTDYFRNEQSIPPLLQGQK